MKRIVKNRDGLRLRSAPDISDDNNIMLVMPLAQPVEVLDAPEGERFWEVETTIDGETKRGFAGHKFLSEPLSDAREALIAGAVKEWNFFVQGAKTETEEMYFQRIGDYWRSVGEEYLDGTDTDQPWSAAFMSFIMRNTAGYPDFLFSTAHCDYIRDAKKKRVNNVAGAPYWLFRLSEHKAQSAILFAAGA